MKVLLSLIVIILTYKKICMPDIQYFVIQTEDMYEFVRVISWTYPHCRCSWYILLVSRYTVLPDPGFTPQTR